AGGPGVPDERGDQQAAGQPEGVAGDPQGRRPGLDGPDAEGVSRDDRPALACGRAAPYTGRERRPACGNATPRRGNPPPPRGRPCRPPTAPGPQAPRPPRPAPPPPAPGTACRRSARPRCGVTSAAPRPPSCARPCPEATSKRTWPATRPITPPS